LWLALLWSIPLPKPLKKSREKQDRACAAARKFF